MASIEQRLEHLFLSKKRKRPSPIMMVALAFAERRGTWLTQNDVISLANKKFANSTVRKAFRELSRPLDVLEGHSFIDLESIKRDDRGRPTIRGRLSEAATERIFELVTPVKEKPPSSFRLILHKEGKSEVPPLLLKSKSNGNKWLPPEDILRIREKKIGKKQTNRLLKGIAKKGKPYAEPVDILEILKNHHFGRLPYHQTRIMDDGQIELASDQNRSCAMVDAILAPATEEDTKRLEAAGIVPCPSCCHLTHRSDLIRVQGAEKDICLTEYFDSIKKCIHSIKHEDGSWSEIVVGIPEIESKGKDKGECRSLLMKKLMNWFREKQLDGSSMPPAPQPQFCLLRERDRLRS
jgi:hypothetical protein